jgi:hypothetical protein
MAVSRISEWSEVFSGGHEALRNGSSQSALSSGVRGDAI